MKSNDTNDMFYGATAKTFEHAKMLRNKMTEGENMLWERLSKKQLLGYKFRRQHPTGGFIADFYCHELKLVIELDGGYHGEQEQRDYDEGRAYEIEELGVTVIRFTNDEVEKDVNDVLERIRLYVADLQQLMARKAKYEERE